MSGRRTSFKGQDTFLNCLEIATRLYLEIVHLKQFTCNTINLYLSMQGEYNSKTTAGKDIFLFSTFHMFCQAIRHTYNYFPSDSKDDQRIN